MRRKEEEDWWPKFDRRAMRWLWDPARPRTGPAGYGILALQVGYLALRDSFRDRLPFQAAALTFTTLLAMVPALAFSFALGKGLGFAENLRKLLINEFTISQAKIIEQLISYVENTKVGTLGVVGLAVLLFSVVLALSSTEETFNRIWDVRVQRPWFRRFADYLFVLIVCPLLIVAATSMWAGLSNAETIQWLLGLAYVGDVARLALGLGPFVALIAAFFFLYMFLPNTKVPLRSAVVGGAVAAVLWYLIQSLYIQFQVGVARYNAIYGGFASLPLFMIWLQVSWYVMLMGAELAHAHHVCLHGPLPELQGSYLSPAREELVALRVMWRVAHAFHRGGEPPAKRQLSRDLAVPVGDLQDVIGCLGEAGLLVEEGEQEVLRPGRSLASITVADLVRAVHGTDQAPSEGLSPEGEQEVLALLEAAQGAKDQALERYTLLELVDAKAAGRDQCS